MGLPQLETCCFVLDLKTGNIVLGCFNAFMSFVLLMIMIVVAATVDSMQVAVEVKDADLINKEAAATAFYVMTIILVLMYLIKFLSDVIFVYGVVTERAGIIKSYFIMFIVFLLLSTFTFSVNLTSYSSGAICMEIFYVCLNVYAILLSYSFYKQLNNREVV